MIDPALLEILACPACRADVRHEVGASGERLVCVSCGRRYPVRDDIPVMLIEEAELPSAPAGGSPAPGR